jgi:hypothetical protein
MFSKSRTDAASPKAAPTSADADKMSRAEKRAEKRAAKAGEKAASQVSGKVGTADRLAAARAAAAAVTDDITSSRASKRAEKKAAKDSDSPVYPPGEEPSFWNLSEWSLRRKVALVLAVPVTLAAVFGGLRVNAERQLADNYAASASQVTVLGPAIAYLAAAEHAAVVARAEGIDNPKLDAAQKEVVDAGTKLVEARDQADLTPTQLRQVNDVISLSEQMRNGMAYVSLTSSVSQVRQLERGVTQIISTIIDEQTRPDPGLLVLAQALDGRLSVALQEIQVSNSKTIPANPVELYTEFGVELASIDRLAISLGQTDPRVLEIRQGNAQRVVNARGGNTKMVGATYDAYDTLIDDVLTDVENGLATSTRNAKVLTWVDSIIIGLALLAAIILALLVSRLLVGPIRRVRAGALEVAHERLPRRSPRSAPARTRARSSRSTSPRTRRPASSPAPWTTCTARPSSWPPVRPDLRAQVGDMFVTLSRRNTSLINQQLGLIETLESDEEDPQRLESLFRLDHLASRMRRNAESLVILSGAPTRATEQDDLSLTDVLQAAIAGVQDYRRVQLDAAPPAGQRRGFRRRGPPALRAGRQRRCPTRRRAPRCMVTSSFTRGAGHRPGDRRRARHRRGRPGRAQREAAAGGEVTPDTARRMGLFVVSRLAQRHGLTVQLDHNDRMGITATVFLPTSVLSDTARLEAGSGGAQVIELGAPQVADTYEHDEHDAYGASDERRGRRGGRLPSSRAGAGAGPRLRPDHGRDQRLRLPQRRPVPRVPASTPRRCPWVAASSTGRPEETVPEVGPRSRSRTTSSTPSWSRPTRSRRSTRPRRRCARRSPLGPVSEDVDEPADEWPTRTPTRWTEGRETDEVERETSRTRARRGRRDR